MKTALFAELGAVDPVADQVAPIPSKASPAETRVSQLFQMMKRMNEGDKV